MRYTLFYFVIFFLYACSGNAKKDTLFSLEEQTGINFVNTVTDQADHNIFKYRNFYNGGGVGIGDINNDGLADIFFTANQGPNKLYLNKGNFQFEDISESTGFGDKKQWSTGVVFVDINHDGFLDIYVCNAGHMQDSSLRKNQLFINDGKLKFTEQAAEYGLDNNGYTTHASFFDYDMDGDLDCFMVNNSPLPVNTLNYANARNVRAENSPVADFLRGGGDHLYRNDNNKFTEVSAEAGIHGTLISFGLGVTVGDVNGDGWPDVYISNDFFERDYLYINQKNGTFNDELEDWIGHTSLASMGTDIADVNNDGYPDIFSTDMLPGDDYRLKTTTAFDNIDVYRLKQSSGFHQQFMQNALQLNNRNGKFKEIAYKTGVEASDWSWGELMFDADNNGFIDIYVCNGIARDLTNQDFIDFFANDIVKDMVLKGKKDDVSSIVDKMPSQKIPNKMYSNQGDLSFREVGENWGLDEPSFSNGAAYGDLDNDGDLDLVINNVNQPAFVYRNNKVAANKGSDADNENHYVGLVLKGKDKNTHAIGARIFLHAGEQVFMRDIMPARGFQSSVDYKQIIGTGSINKYDSLKILWPDNTVSVVTQLYPDTVLTFNQSELPSIKFQPVSLSATTLLSKDPQQFAPHKENDHVDFYAERNIPQMLSREGPDAAVADVNGDKLEDIFICGAHNQNGKLYIQKQDGSFEIKPQPSI
ncbi:MAG: CRTAC1 family protein, partial [Flavitalea sp.]